MMSNKLIIRTLLDGFKNDFEENYNDILEVHQHLHRIYRLQYYDHYVQKKFSRHTIYNVCVGVQYYAVLALSCRSLHFLGDRHLSEDAHYWKTARYRVHTLRTVWPDHDVRGVYYISLDYDSNAYYPPRGHRENGTDCAFRFFNHFFHDPTTALNAHEIVCVVL